MRLTQLLGTCSFAAAIVAAATAQAQNRPEFVQSGRTSIAVHRPASGPPPPHIAILVTHRTANNLNNIACREMAARGFLGVCFNTRFVNNEAAVKSEEIMLDVKAAFDYAKSQPGITKVILLGHSGGSPVMSLYQAVAENGVQYCRKPERLTTCDFDVPALTPADGMIYPDAHPGNPAQAVRGINPSLVIENGKIRVIPELDPFNPANGYNPKGPSNYSKAFQTRYYAAQSKVMTDQLNQVLAAKGEDGEGRISVPGR